MTYDTSSIARDSRSTALALQCTDPLELVNTLIDFGYMRVRRAACEIARLQRRDAIVAIFITNAVIFLGSRSAGFELLQATQDLVFENGGAQSDA